MNRLETEYESKRLPNNQPIDYRQIQLMRVLRNKTQREFADLMGIKHTTLCAIERGKIPFSPYYEDKVRDVFKRLSVSNAELVSTRQLINRKAKRRYSH